MALPSEGFVDVEAGVLENRSLPTPYEAVWKRESQEDEGLVPHESIILGGSVVSIISQSGVIEAKLRRNRAYGGALIDSFDAEDIQPFVNAPVKPVIEVGTRSELGLALASNEYSHPDLIEHESSRWQLGLVGGSFSTPAYDTGSTESDLEDHNMPEGSVAADGSFVARVRHEDSTGFVSDWSDPSSPFVMAAPILLELLTPEDIEPRFTRFEGDCEEGEVVDFNKDEGSPTSFTECEDAIIQS